MKYIVYLSLLLYKPNVFSQFHKDTTYTIISEYKKQNKKYPFISIANSTPNSFVTKQTDIIYHSTANRDLHLDAYLYESNKKLPALLLIHGGGWKSGNKSMMKALAEQVVVRGYHCFAIEYRLSDEAKYPAAVEDILLAIKYLKRNAKSFRIDSTKIALMGCSSGGQLVSLIGTKYYAESKAIINLDGILAFHHPQSKEGQLASFWLGGTFEEKPEIWEDASALTHVDQNCPPFLFINSQHKRFHAGRDEMITKMNKFNIDSRVETIPDSPHTFWLFHPWFNQTINYIITFLDEKLK